MKHKTLNIQNTIFEVFTSISGLSQISILNATQQYIIVELTKRLKYLTKQYKTLINSIDVLSESEAESILNKIIFFQQYLYKIHQQLKSTHPVPQEHRELYEQFEKFYHTFTVFCEKLEEKADGESFSMLINDYAHGTNI